MGSEIVPVSHSGEDTPVDMEEETRDRSLDALVHTHPELELFALDDLGYRTAVPAGFPAEGRTVLPVPSIRQTTAELVVPADWLTVVSTWERARTQGIALAVVRPVHDPDTPHTLTMIDARHRYGVWLCGLSDLEATDVPVAGAPAAPNVDEFRPRTATMVKSNLAMITAIDERTTQMLGWTAEQMVGVRAIEFIHPDDHERAITNYIELLSRQDTQRVRLRHRCADGSWLWVEIDNTYVAADDPDDVAVVAQVSDISDEMAAQVALARSEHLFRRLAETVPTGLLQVDPERKVVFVNERVTQILGTGHGAELPTYLEHVRADDRRVLDAALTAAIDHGIEREIEVAVAAPDGETRACTITCVALEEGDGSTGALVCVNDVTESVRLREELTVRATLDALTGCYNRASVVAAVDHLLGRDDRSTAVVFIDLDGFKAVNDRLGHAAGDEMLVQTAKLLSGLVRGDDIVGRIGGDEFLLVCPGLEHPEQAQVIGARVAGVLHTHLDMATGSVPLRASIGVAVSDHDSTSDLLIARADAAMYVSKRRGDGSPVFWQAEMDSRRRVGRATAVRTG